MVMMAMAATVSILTIEPYAVEHTLDGDSGKTHQLS